MSSDNSNKLQGATCVGFSEIDKYATQIYQKHFPNHKNYGDITTINEKELPDFELLVGGFPCQAFSIAGKRGGFEDTRGTMFFELARILREKQPRLFVFENVKGLLSHDQGRTFHTIIATLDELGYDCQWQVLNSKNHGVPQNRERVFIIGHLRGTPRPEVFPFGEGGHENLGPSTTAQAINNPSRGYEARKDGLASALRAGEMGHKNIIQLNQPKHSNDRVYGTEGVSPTLNTMQGGNRQPFVQQRPRGNNKGGKHEIAPTLSISSWQYNNHLNAIRRLTPTECERLQGFPDGWTEGVSDTQRYKTLGNAVTVNVIKDIVEKLI
jgi:DNA (cytosine-5)-methyltransferase 1